MLTLACTDPTGTHAPTAVFVLRTLDGNAVPATATIRGAPYSILADTLFVDPPNAADGNGVLQRSVTGAPVPALPALQRNALDFIWLGGDLSVLFDCPVGTACALSFGYDHGTITGNSLRFPANGITPERIYERVR